MTVRAKKLIPKAGAGGRAGEKHLVPDGVVEFRRQKTLLKKGALQDAIFNSAYFSSIATDEKGVIQIFNVGAERMLGYAAVDVMDHVTPADFSDPQELIARAAALSLEFGTPITPGFEALVFKASRGIEDIYELTKIRKDGSRFPAIVSVTSLRDDGGAIIGYLLIGTDNTARKQAEEALLKAGALQSAIFNSANFSSIATDAKGVIQIFNVGAERMLGYAAADVVNKITPADISDPQELIARAEALSLELGTPITPGFEALVFKASRGIEDIYELTYIRKDGSRFGAVVSVTALRDAQDVIIGYLLIGTDNTARQQAEEALLKAGALQSAIFNSANFSSIATDANGVIQIFNVGAEKMLGYTATEVMNKITPADISDPQEVIARAAELSLELGTPITPGFEALVFKASRGIEDIYELTYFRKDGSRFPAIVSVTALRDADNRIIGYLLIGTDNTARKQAEKALREAGALQAAIFNSANFSSIATDAKGVIQIFNVGAERMLGYTAADVVNRITPADISDPREVIARAKALSVELGTPITPGFEALVFKASRGIEDIYELTYIRKDGSRFPAVVSVTALRDAQDAIIGYLLIGTEIKAGALQSAIFNSANFSSIATDAKGVIQIFNVGAERMLGYTAAEVTNKITPADISDPEEVIARAAELSLEFATTITPGFEALVFKASRGIEDIYELTYIRKDGSRFPAVVSVTALRDAQETIIGYLLIGTDNTARKQVEADRALLDQRLRDQQFYTRSLIESNIDALMTTDPQGIISDVNQQMIALTGRTRDELIGAPCRNFFTDPLRADAAIKRVLNENKVSDYELTVRAQNGQETVVSYNAATFHDRDRKLQGVFAAARDVTERRRFERALQEKKELEHASRMKSEFLATMSHELRTPLNAIIGFSEALRDGLVGQMTEVQHEYIGDIFSSGQHLLSLINDILDLSKVEAGMMTLDLEAVDLNSILSSSLSIVREKAAARRITLELETGEDLGIPQVDMRKTKQIVYNLLSNAVKFTADNGRVTLRARRVSRSTVGTLPGAWPVHGFPLADSEYSEFLEIRVSDNGIGISRENMAKLFQAFSQVDTSLARKFEGTGLGLAMVKQLAELHGGAVAVASAEGEGACFAAWLPLRNPARAAATQSPGAATLAGTKPNERIALVVEHDDRLADLVRVLLEEEGYSVLRAASPEAALLQAPDQTLSLITLDLELPGAGGLAFLQRMRENSALANVPVVIIAGPADSNMALAGGAATVLQKPVSRAQLKASLATLGLHPAEEHTHTVLVVDDDPAAVEVIAMFLPSPAYAVVRAYGGKEAITLARRLHPDLILLDLMMPETNGFDVVEALQRDGDTARIPILVVTAKEITALDRATLNSNPDKVIHIVEKAGFNRLRFLAEVRRALPPRESVSTNG